MEIKNIGIHHFAGRLTLAELNAVHKSEWPDFPSKLRPDLYVGYNIVIWKDGTWLQARYIGEETAAQKGHNLDTISISLYGDFSVGKDKPSDAQKITLKWLIENIELGKATEIGLKILAGTKISIIPGHIFPHRILQPNHTECYGSSLSDAWARDLAFPPVPIAPPIDVPPLPAPPSEGPALSIWMQIAEKIIELLNLKILFAKRLGGARYRGCVSGARG